MTSSTPDVTVAFVKVEFAGDECAEFHEKLFFETFSPHYHRVIKDGDRTQLTTDLETPAFYETTFKIESVNGFDETIFELAREFTCGQKNVKVLASRATLVLHSAEFFDATLISTKKSIKTSRFAFGNLYSNVFLGHWTTSSSNKIHELTTNFHFDTATPVTVNFGTKTPGRYQMTSYSVCIDDSTIHRVIVDGFCLYFVLDSPARITKSAAGQSKKRLQNFERIFELTDGQFTSDKKVLSENNVMCVELETSPETYAILSRLRRRWRIPIAFAMLVGTGCLIPETTTSSVYCQWMRNGIGDLMTQNDAHFSAFLARSFPHPRAEPGVRYKAADKMNERRFAYVYMITALISRGAVVKDQLIRFELNWVYFLLLIEQHLRDDEKFELCESALEDLLNHVDQQPTRPGDLIRTFGLMCERRRQTRVSNQMTTEQWDDGMRKIRKVILTPSRRLFMAPEVIMSNRAVNSGDHDGTRILRVAFRDENCQPMRAVTMKSSMRNVLLEHLTNGFKVMNRHYGFLGASNSQMREGGAYFMECYNQRDASDHFGNSPIPVTFKPKIHDFRKKLGKFEDTGSIPKAMARLGQCFTQARACTGCEIGAADYKLTFDVIGGKNASGDTYTFSDGIGIMSMRLARRIAKDLKLSHVPSAFQFRFRGVKGMMSVEPTIDEVDEHFGRVYPGNKMAPWSLECLFRPSQLKFKCSKGKKDKWPIEVVKWSSTAPVMLNRPFISVLDHVSAIQSFECHRRVCRRVEELMDIQMESFAKSMFNERSCRARLEDMPRRVFAPALKENLFTLSTEPFFRSLIKAAIDSALMRLLSKIQIQIPNNLGRSMYGVIDETGQLQSGQVFIKYTVSMSSQNAGHATTITHKGPVLITKFPATVSGDVRMFEAVDVPELAHLRNVVVFPQSGPRSHPDEMAGSDLDGDEYAVIWDPDLFLLENEKAFAYNSTKPPSAFNKDDMDSRMHNFYAEYMELDSVGHIAINHLYQSDQFGIESKVCQSLAEKGSMALDYAKSGVAPTRLTNRWTRNKETGVVEAPEVSERCPDFSLAHYRPISKPMYTSSRLLGTLFRELKCVNDVVNEASENHDDVEMDPLIDVVGWQEYRRDSEEQMKMYNGQLRSLMHFYGIQSEAEIFSGCYKEIRRRISNKEQDDMSLYNTEYVIETKMTELFRSFREKFFEEFADGPMAFLKFTESTNRYDESTDNVLKRVCTQPSDRMMAKAVAYYRVCYGTKTPQSEEQKLSFAWIAYDVLNFVKTRNVIAQDILPRQQRHLQLQTINKHRHSFIEENREDFRNSLRRVYQENDHLERKMVEKYYFMYPGIQKCIFVIEQWAMATNLLLSTSQVAEKLEAGSDKREVMKTAAESRLQWYHLALLVIMFATGNLGAIGDSHTSTLPLLEPREVTEEELDEITLSFFKYLASRRFRRLRHVSFTSVGISSVFMRGEWTGYHTVAVRTYYNLLLNRRFDELPIGDETGFRRRRQVKEGVPFVINLPKGIDGEAVQRRLNRMVKDVEVVVRVESDQINEFDRLIISSRGTLEGLQLLRDLVSFKMPRYIWQLERSISGEIASLIYWKIMKDIWIPTPKTTNNS